MLKIWICHIRIQLTGVIGLVGSVRPWTRRSWLLLMVFCCFMNSPALDFQSPSHSPNPLSSVAWGLSLMCMPVLFPCPVCPTWKAPHSRQKDISKNTKGELCQDGHFYAWLCWVSLATTAVFSPCPWWGNLFWDQECAQPCSLSSQLMGILGGAAAAASFWGFPRWASQCRPMMADGVGGSAWLHLPPRLPWQLSASEQGVGCSALAQLGALLSCSLRRTGGQWSMRICLNRTWGP